MLPKLLHHRSICPTKHVEAKCGGAERACVLKCTSGVARVGTGGKRESGAADRAAFD